MKEQQKPKSKFFTGEDGSLSTSKFILYVTTMLICLWIMRDLYYNVGLTWEHAILFIALFMGSILNRIDTKRMASRLTSIAISKDGIDIDLDSEVEEQKRESEDESCRFEKEDKSS